MISGGLKDDLGILQFVWLDALKALFAGTQLALEATSQTCS